MSPDDRVVTPIVGTRLAGEVFEPGEAEAATRPPSRRPVVVIALLLVTSVLVAAVVALRPPAPQPAASAATDTNSAAPTALGPFALDWAGFGDILLGTSATDFRAGHRDLSGWESTVRVPGRDTEHECVQYQIASRTGPTVWVWARDDRIATVGIDPVGAAATSFGPRLGDPFGVGGAIPPDWVVDTAAGIFVARGSNGDTIATLADTDADGLLDYATVSSPAGDLCELDPPAAERDRPRESGPDELDGLTLDGVGAAGAVVTDVEPSSPDDWFGTAEVTLSGGCPATVHWQRAPGVVAGIDRPVWADSALGPPIVTDTLAVPC